MNFLTDPWPWYVVGPLIGLFVPIMVILDKVLGISSNLRHVCALILPKKKLSYLQYDVKSFHWNLFFFGGLFLGGLIGSLWFTNEGHIPLLPSSYQSIGGILILLVGGLLIGFGTRYADGCTSGHSISGLSNLQKTSLIATLCFFAGGLTMRLINFLLGGIL